MTTTKAIARHLLTQALAHGHTLSIPFAGGDVVTVGRGTGPSTRGKYEALRWGRSRWAAPSGRTIAASWMPQDVALAVVEHCGRGAVGRTHKEKTMRLTKPVRFTLRALYTPRAPEDIAKLLGAPLPNVQRRLSRMAEAGWIEKVYHQKTTDCYQITLDGQDVVGSLMEREARAEERAQRREARIRAID